MTAGAHFTERSLMFNPRRSVILMLLAGIAGLFWSANIEAQTREARRISLDEAQAQAALATEAHLAQLGVDAAKYHRQAAEADYLPKIDATMFNVHYNKFMGQSFQLFNRSGAVPILGKNETLTAFTVTQPVTPLLKVRQAVKIAKADEVVARAKAAQFTAEVQTNVEK